MKNFKSIGTLIKSKRTIHPEKYSQVELSNLMGYKNGQFISNVERGLCGIPLNKAKLLCKTLDIKGDEFLNAVISDKKSDIMESLM